MLDIRTDAIEREVAQIKQISARLRLMAQRLRQTALSDDNKGSIKPAVNRAFLSEADKLETEAKKTGDYGETLRHICGVIRRTDTGTASHTDRSVRRHIKYKVAERLITQFGPGGSRQTHIRF